MFQEAVGTVSDVGVSVLNDPYGRAVAIWVGLSFLMWVGKKAFTSLFSRKVEAVVAPVSVSPTMSLMGRRVISEIQTGVRSVLGGVTKFGCVEASALSGVLKTVKVADKNVSDLLLQGDRPAIVVALVARVAAEKSKDRDQRRLVAFNALSNKVAVAPKFVAVAPVASKAAAPGLGMGLKRPLVRPGLRPLGTPARVA